MRGEAVLAFSVVLILICAEHCEGNECNVCDSTSENGCDSWEAYSRRVMVCGTGTTDANIRLMKEMNSTLGDILATLNRKHRFYANKTKYIATDKMIKGYIADIQDIINLKLPLPPFFIDDVYEFTGKQYDTIGKYIAILKKWKKDENAKVALLWDKTITPKMEKLKEEWKRKTKNHMPEPPYWRLIFVQTNRLLEYDEYEELMHDWINGAEKSIASGDFTPGFDKDVARKWSSDHSEVDDFYYSLRRKRQDPPNNNSLFQDLPIDESWCAKFQSPKLGVRMGCGVQLEGFVFENGCHEMSAPYEGIKYCRCDDYFRCSEQEKKEILDKLDKMLNETLSRPHYNFTHSDSSRRSPCVLMLVVTFWVTMTS